MYRLGSQGRSIQNQLQNGDPNSGRPLQLQGTGMREAQRIPQQLDYLLAEIISPNEDTNVIGYLAYYYPKLKNEQNVALLTDFFLRCPTYFSHSKVVSLKKNYPVMEAFNYIMNTKFKISQPTVPFYRFYAALVASLLNCEKTDPSHHWKLIPILTGILLSIKGRDDVELYPDHSRSIKGNDTVVSQLLQRCLTRFYYSGDARNYDLNALVIISMSCALDYVRDDTIKKIVYRYNYTRAIIDLIYYSPYGLNDSDIPLLADNSVNEQSFDQLLNENPALKHLSRLSFLFERTVKLNDGSIQSNLNDIDISLNKMQSFSEKLSKKITFLDDDNSKGVGQLLRQCLYATIIIHQAILTTFFQLDNTDYTKYFLPSFSRKILSILFNLFFIVDRIGTGGFEPYNFVYLTCLQGIIQYDMKTAESLVKTFTTGINYASLKESEVSRAKLLFTLNLMEQVVNICSDDLRLELIVPLVEDLVSNKNASVDVNNHVFKSIFESAHSVILKFFTVVDSSVKNVDYEKNVCLVSEKIIPYLTLVIDQFPEFLSINQLDVAIETISRTVFPDSPIYNYDKNISSMFLNVLFNKCLTVGHDDLIELNSSDTKAAPKGEEENSLVRDESDNEPKALQSLTDLKSKRSALISALISVFPLIPVKDYTKWLSIAFYDLIVPTPEKTERSFLQERLWDCVVGTNKYDPQKGNLGIMWWYENVNAQSIAKL